MLRRSFLSSLQKGAKAGFLLGSVPSFFSFLGGGRCAYASSLPPIEITAQERQNYRVFLKNMRLEAENSGISSKIIKEAFACTTQPNGHVLALDRHQPEFTLTWAQYRERVLPQTRLQEAKKAYHQVASLLSPLTREFSADDSVVMGIWGLETHFGAVQGHFNIIDSLTTLAFDGRRKKFFKSELMNALRILESGDIKAHKMLGSYAGAMGQPQFMPSAYLRYAVDGDHDGKRDIWTSRSDVFASISHYLAKRGWRRGLSWGQEVVLPSGNDGGASLAAQKTKLAHWQKRSDWQRMGVAPLSGKWAFGDEETALLQPDGAAGEVFLVTHNFKAIRAYNPSDYYALGVGLLGSATV